MNKRLFRNVALAGLLLGATAASAQAGLPGSGWYTTAVIQNVTSESATVNIEALPQGSGTPSTASFNIAPNANAVFFPGSGGANGNVDVTPALGSGFVGSMVVSSTQPVVAVGQVTNYMVPGMTGVGIAGGFASGQYRGTNNPSATLTYPAVKNNFGGKTTVFAVQAAGADVTYTATIRDSAGGTHTKTGSLGANRSVTLIPSDFSPPMVSSNCGADPNTSPCFGSLTVTATGNIAGSMVESFNNQSPAKAAQAASMFAATEASNAVYCPIFKNTWAGNQRTTGITVANTSGSSVNVSVEFTITGSTAGDPVGKKYTTGATIPGNKSVAFTPFQANIGGMPAGSLAAATIRTSSNALVATVSESNFPAAGSATPQKQTIYTCFNAAGATSKIAAPIFKKDAGNNTTGIAVQNANASGAVTVNATFVCRNAATGASATFGPLASTSLNPGQSYVFYRPGQVPNGNVCAVTLNSGSTSNKIIAVVNESSDDFAGTTTFNLDTKNYEGFNVQ